MFIKLVWDFQKFYFTEKTTVFLRLYKPFRFLATKITYFLFYLLHVIIHFLRADSVPRSLYIYNIHNNLQSYTYWDMVRPWKLIISCSQYLIPPTKLNNSNHITVLTSYYILPQYNYISTWDAVGHYSLGE